MLSCWTWVGGSMQHTKRQESDEMQQYEAGPPRLQNKTSPNILMLSKRASLHNQVFLWIGEPARSPKTPKQLKQVKK